MAWHILASSYFDFDAIERDADADRAPRHFLRFLSQEIKAPIHQPSDPNEKSSTSMLDRLAAVFYSEPEFWAMARRVRRQLEPGDGVYAAGSNAGLPLALLCALSGPRQVKFAIAVTDAQRPKIRLFGWLLALLRTKWLMIVPHTEMVDVGSKGFGRFLAGIMAINGLTDFDFFRPRAEFEDGLDTAAEPAPGLRPEPGPGSGPGPKKARTLVASCGTEARDYDLLAKATAGMDLDVKVCFASPNLTAKTRFTVPDPMPDYMEIRYFSFAELRQLYQDADVVVVPVLPNRYAAGLTTVFEAVACGRPVVVARSPGVVDELIARDLVGWYEMGDGDGLRQAIENVLADPGAAQAKADKAHEWVRTHYSAEAYLRRIFQALQLAFGHESPGRDAGQPAISS